MELHTSTEIFARQILIKLCILVQIIYNFKFLSIFLVSILPSFVYSSMKNDTICTLEQFACRSGNGECIALNWMCDDNPDCIDGSDEIDCNETCRSDEFTCSNKHCIQQRWVCDYDDDCGDTSDESNCSTITCDPYTDFDCSTNYCIISRWYCDGDFDCPDKSDELHCKNNHKNEHLIYCTNDEFNCGDQITCIHRSWLCDGDKDCPNGADEIVDKCKNNTCQNDQFQCIDRYCLSDELLCDGKIDCIDGNDETNCSKLLHSCERFTEFECSNGLCIPLLAVCNKKSDCIGSEDENEELCGINECLINNGGCSQKCIDLPIGYRCDCNFGYSLVDNITCNDINECLNPGSCSQFCTNVIGGFKCSCASGYLRDPRNRTRCKAAEGHASLLFARRHDIRKVALDRNEMTALVNGTKMATALDFVFRTGMIFWSDVSEKKIYKAPIDEGNDRTSIIDKDLTISDGLAVDWIYNHIYWTDAEKNTIELSNLDGNMRKTLITDHIQKPRAIALNPLDGWMFWTDWSTEARIEKAGMDGSHRTIIIGIDIKWPNGLTLDLIGKRVYWVDAKLNIIGSCSYDGSNRRTILHSLDTLKHPFSITMFEDYIYWTDWNKETIFKANKFNGKELEAITSLRSLHHPMAVHVYHPYKQPDGINQCQVINGHCSHLCLPAPKINSRSPLLSCACPDKLILLSDGLTCVENVSGHEKPFNTNSLNYEFKDSLLISGFLIGTVTIGLVMLSFFAVICYKQSFQHHVSSMNFDNPIYKMTSEKQLIVEKRFSFSDKIEHEVCICALTSPT